jgi:hypothetical protein
LGLVQLGCQKQSLPIGGVLKVRIAEFSGILIPRKSRRGASLPYAYANGRERRGTRTVRCGAKNHLSARSSDQNRIPVFSVPHARKTAIDPPPQQRETFLCLGQLLSFRHSTRGPFGIPLRRSIAPRPRKSERKWRESVGQGKGNDQRETLNSCLFMRRLLILESRVCRGIPNLAAAPLAPDTRP